ncbi:alpha/beta fold hydrolase [bacterium]|nr:alpha/beta fold hydrolase [bacterium]
MGLHIYPVTIKTSKPAMHCLLSRPTSENRSRPTIIYFHGLNGTRNQIFQDKNIEFAETIQNLGCNLLAAELPYHGERREKKDQPAAQYLIKHIHHEELNPFNMAFNDFKAIIDFLIEKRIATPSKIAVAGMSWGALHALYALKKDRRIRCCIALLPVCKITTLVEFRNMETEPIIQKHEPLQFIENIAPKPLLMLTAEKGSRSDPKYAVELYRKLQAEYHEADAEDCLAYSMILGAGHAYHPKMSQMVVNWLETHLLVEEEGPQFYESGGTEEKLR